LHASLWRDIRIRTGGSSDSSIMDGAIAAAMRRGRCFCPPVVLSLAAVKELAGFLSATSVEAVRWQLSDKSRPRGSGASSRPAGELQFARSDECSEESLTALAVALREAACGAQEAHELQADLALLGLQGGSSSSSRGMRGWSGLDAAAADYVDGSSDDEGAGLDDECFDRMPSVYAYQQHELAYTLTATLLGRTGMSGSSALGTAAGGLATAAAVSKLWQLQHPGADPPPQTRAVPRAHSSSSDTQRGGSSSTCSSGGGGGRSSSSGRGPAATLDSSGLSDYLSDYLEELGEDLVDSGIDPDATCFAVNFLLDNPDMLLQAIGCPGSSSASSSSSSVARLAASRASAGAGGAAGQPPPQMRTVPQGHGSSGTQRGGSSSTRSGGSGRSSGGGGRAPPASAAALGLPAHMVDAGEEMRSAMGVPEGGRLFVADSLRQDPDLLRLFTQSIRFDSSADAADAGGGASGSSSSQAAPATQQAAPSPPAPAAAAAAAGAAAPRGAKVCAYCGEHASRLSKCSGCAKVAGAACPRYCGKACQVADWKQHRAQCGKPA
jgi:hypothetical protein